jgi:UPF0042 nucleotide-binding protein
VIAAGATQGDRQPGLALALVGRDGELEEVVEVTQELPGDRLGETADPSRLAIQLISFGFKYGVPLEADLVFDVRFMQNPYYIDELRQLSGLTEPVRAFVLGQPVAQAFLRFLRDFLTFAIPAYQAEGKTRLTIALGCTGGFQRSIALAEELAAWLPQGDFGPLADFHRELDRT